MDMVKRRALALAAVVVGLIGLLALAPSASAYPGGTGGVSVGTTTPSAGGSLTVSGSSCAPNSVVTISLDGSTSLGSANTDGSGSYSTVVTLPSGISGSHTITVSGASCSAVAGIDVGGGSGSGSSGGGSSGGSLAGTGVAVIGIGAIGVVLLVGGGLMLLAGRRRNKISV